MAIKNINTDVNITGNLTVGGTTTTINTTTVEVKDNILQLNTTPGSPNTATATASGISIYRGDGITQASLIFDDADDTWDLTNNLVIGGSISAGAGNLSGQLTVNSGSFNPLKLDRTAASNVNMSFYHQGVLKGYLGIGSTGDLSWGLNADSAQNNFIIHTGNIANQSVANAGTIDGLDSTALYRRIYANNYESSPTSRWYVVTLPYDGNSGWSNYFYFDVLAYRDLGNLQSQLHYRVYLHNRGASANNNILTANVTTELGQTAEFAEFGYKNGGASSSQFFIKLGEDYSGISIVAYPGQSTLSASMIAAQDTAPAGFTAITPAPFIKSGGTSSQFLKADGSFDSSVYLTTVPVPLNGSWWNEGYVRVGTDGVMEMGKYMDFHTSNSGGSADYDLRVTVSSTTFAVGGSVSATSFVKSGGTSSQFLKADGSVDSSSYSLTSHTHTSENVSGWYARDTTNIDTFDPDGNWTTAISNITTVGTKPSSYVTVHNLGGNGVDFQSQIATYYGNNNKTWIRSRYDVTNDWVAWDELITSANIGSQSVANAITLDSLDSTQFLRSDESDTMSGSLTVTGSIKSEGPDGGMVMRNWQAGATYGMIGTANMTSNEYALITNGVDTFIGGGSGGTTHIRSGNNDSNPQLVINGTNSYFDGGNLGVGTSAPSRKLEVAGDAYIAGEFLATTNGLVRINQYDNGLVGAGEIALWAAGGTGWGVGDGLGRIRFYTNDASGIGARDVARIEALSDSGNGTTTTVSSGALAFYTSASNANVVEAMRINSAGYVGVGTASPATALHVLGSAEGIYVGRIAGSVDYGGHVRLQKARGSVTTPAIVANGDTLGTLTFEPHNGTAYTEQVGIRGIVNGTVTTGSIPSDLYFSAGSSGSTAANERMRIKSDGRVGIGTASPSGVLHVADRPSQVTLLLGRASGVATIKSDGTADGHMIIDSGTGGTAVWLQNYTSGNVYLATGGGNVGIATTSPSEKLTVNGNIDFPFSTSGTTYIGIQGSPTNPFSTGARELVIRGANAYTAGTATQAQAGGDVYIKGGYAVANTSIGVYAGDVYIDGGTTSGGSTTGAGNVYIRTADEKRIYVNNIGNVGIGIESQGAKLDVDGFTQSLGVSSNSVSKTYTWRLNNTGNSGNIWRRICRFDSQQSGRIKIEMVGQTGYGSNASFGSVVTIIGQINNGNNLQGSWWVEGYDAAVFAVGFELIAASQYYINVLVGSYSEYAITATISVGTLTLSDTTVSGTSNVTKRRWFRSESVFLDGNVGIGLTNPARKLQLTGGDFYTSDRSDTIGASVGYGGNSFQIRNGNTSEDLNFDVYNRTTSAWYTPMIIKNTGNVGIGTDDPSDKLQVVGSASIINIKSTTAGANSNVHFETTARRWGIGANMALGNSSFEIYDYTAGSNRFVLDSDGDVGIGVTTPSQKLHVNGNILAGSWISTNTTSTRGKYSVWGGDLAYAIGMGSGYSYGYLGGTSTGTDYAMSFQMNNSSTRGFWWGDSTHTNAQGAMSLTTDGKLMVASLASIGYGETATTPSTTYALDVNGTIRATGSIIAASYLTSVDFSAPIFYDSDDPGYYVDPNSFSVINNLTILGSLTYGSFSPNQSGYTKLPNGIIIQWGRYVQTGSSAVYGFPTTFPNACQAIWATKGRTSTAAGSQTNAAGVGLLSTSQFYLDSNDAGGTGWVTFILAIGY
jgi:hypothetical protein